MNIQFIDDFLRGQRDCEKGIPHQLGNSPEYDRGYAAEYEMSAIQDEITVGDYVVRG